MRCKGRDLFWIAQRFPKLFSTFVANIFAMEKCQSEIAVNNEKVIQLPKIVDERGNLSFIEELRHIPFAIERVYWIYDVPGGEERGSHAFREQEEFIVALSGSFDVVLHDGKEERRYQLNRSYKGIYVPRMTWRRMENFSTNSLCLVLSSTRYDEADYIRDFDEFVFLAGREKSFSQREKKNAEAIPLPAPYQLSRLADACRTMQLPKVHNRAGNLTAMNNLQELSFATRRVYYLYDIPCGEQRGGHAHRQLEQLLVAVGGSFSVTLDDGHEQRTVFLNSPFQALYIGPGIWRTLENFSSGAVCLVLASHPYDEADYIREYDQFLECKCLK